MYTKNKICLVSGLSEREVISYEVEFHQKNHNLCELAIISDPTNWCHVIDTTVQLF